MKINILNSIHQVKINHILLLLITLAVGGIISFGFRIYQANVQNKAVQGVSTIKTEDINRDVPTEIPNTPYATVAPRYVDPNPIVSCNINANCGGGTKQMRQNECSMSTCCQVVSGGKWSLFPSLDSCKAAQDAAYKQPTSINTPLTAPSYNSGHNPPTLINCVVSYPCTGNSYTYQFTQEYCSNAQQQAASTCSSSNNTSQSYMPTPTQPIQKSTSEIQKCKDEVRAKYDNLIRGCYIRYEGSAANMCASGYQGQSGTESLACEK